MPDFTAHRHLVLVVRCPECGKAPGVWCRRPSGHRASDLHKARRIAADCLFVTQHGEDASIERVGEDWVIDPKGRAERREWAKAGGDRLSYGKFLITGG